MPKKNQPKKEDERAFHCRYDELKDVTELVANPRNPNEHGSDQISLLAKIITAQGWRTPVVVSKQSGFIVSGHGRVKAAMLMDDKRVPVSFQDFENDAQEWSHLIADNRIAELADLSDSKLAEILEDLDKAGADFDLTAFSETDIERILRDSNLTVGDDIELGDEIEGDDEEVNEGVRMVQLYYDQDNFLEFSKYLDFVSKHTNTANTTDAVLAAMKIVHDENNTG